MTDLTPPPAAQRVFGAQLDRAQEYVSLLATSGVQRGLIGPREVPRLWTRHVLNCAVVGELVPHGASVLDVGSGAGLPGIALSLARPDLDVVLVEPLLRRASWLDEVLEALEAVRGGDRGRPVRVLRGRAEELVGTMEAPVVTARAVAPLDRLAQWCVPLLRPGGELLAVKGRSAPDELAQHGAALRELGVESADVVQCGTDVLAEVTTVIRARVGAVRRAGQGRRVRRR